jgi:orotate phosphoribosyltransferase
MSRIKAASSDWISEGGFRDIGETLEAFWENLGEPGTVPYHAIMVSGLHTNGFVNVSTYMAETNLAEPLAAELILRMGGRFGLKSLVDVVVGPALAAVTLSYEVARQLRCRHGFTEKDKDGRTTKIGGRMRIRPGERVLVVNELMSTANGSTQQTREGILLHQPEAVVLPFSGILVNRSGLNATADGIGIRSVFNYAMKTWTPEDCPHCKAGSRAIKPKITEENWLKLTGKIP